MKRKFTLSEERKRTIFSVATSIVSMAVLFLSLTTLNYLITEEGTLDKLPLFLFGIFAMIAASPEGRKMWVRRESLIKRYR